ncbi:MAG: TRAP transporter large permease subunit [Aestuariivita sp.]
MPSPVDPMNAEAADPAAPPGLQRYASMTLRVLDVAIGAFAVLALTALVLIVFANVVARYGFNSSFIWALEAARWLFITVILLGVPLAHRLRSHLVISLLVDALPHNGQRAVTFVANFIIAYTTIMLMFGGNTLMQMIGGVNVSLHLPQWTPYLAIPMSCTLGLVYLALRGFDEGVDRWQGLVSILAAFVVYFLFQDAVTGALRGFDPVLAMGVSFAVALMIGTPVSFAMLFSAFVANFAGNILPPAAVVQNMVNGSSKFLMLAIPFFILAGAMMNTGGLTNRLMEFATSLVGHMRGGLAQVNIVSSGLYAGVSGSSYSDAALGTKLLVPQMIKRGYSAPFSCAVTAASATLPNVIPPSIALLILAAAGNLSVGKLWLAGVIPGIVMALMLMVLIYVISLRRGYGGDTPKAGMAQRGRLFLHALPVLLLALLIIAGIRFGVVTPTEAGVLAVMYAALLGILVYRSWTPGTLYETIRGAAVDAALVGFLIGAASPFAFVLVSQQVPQSIARALPGLTDNTIVLLLLANLILLLFGMLLDIGASILILTPLLMPAMVAAGVDPIHFGIVIVVNLMIGGLSPPVGMLAFITSSVSGTPVHHVFQSLLPFIGILLVALALITFIPGISLGLGQLLTW